MAFLNINQVWYIFRMIFAGICGCIIGLERKNRAKEAGVRTHCVVALASALMMIISKYCFADMPIGIDGVRGADGARVAAQVVSGIGFLGAGMIFVHKNTVTGLTTAAGIWATSGIGMAIGGGMYIVGGAATILVLFAQILFHRGFINHSKPKKLVIRDVATPGYQTYLTTMLENIGVTVQEVHIERTNNLNTYTFIVDVPQGVIEEDIIGLFDFDCKIASRL